MKLNPLHTPEWLAQQVLNTGCYPDTSRMTGRSTAQALKFLARAIEQPHVPVKVVDHAAASNSVPLSPSCFLNQSLTGTVEHIAATLGLQFIKCDKRNCTVTFTR